jgi:5-methylcytosine-specific restriction protein A
LGYTCLVCGFDFAATYGPIGEHYIECHHMNPLSERPEEEQLDGTTTSVEEVVVVCANCHRMLHRRRPALEVAVLKASLPA